MSEGVRDPSSHRTPAQIRKMNRGYDKKPSRRKARAKANAARKKLGLKVGDPRDAHHIKPQRSGGSNAKSNLKAVHRSKNRGWESEKTTKKYLRPGERKKSPK